MAPRKKTAFICQSCGYQAPKWLGKCPGCGEWNSMAEEVTEPPENGKRGAVMDGPKGIGEIPMDAEMRWKTGLSEFDRVLGGGVVPGSAVLIGGDPGIGKSTLMLQVLDRLAGGGHRALYLSGEESSQQIKLRAQRLSVQSDALFVISGTCMEDFFREAAILKPDLVAVDSIQTIYTDTMASAPGSIGQVREVAARFLAFAKASGVPVFLIGHVTKEGAIAGPRILEHLVDTVLYFEGDRGHVYRILRSVKNRFGSTNEIGVFEMKDTGLAEVDNPSRLFLEERPEGTAGSVVIPCLEGTRPVLLEIQALVSPSPLGMPRRTAVGVDHNRISLLVAVLAKRAGIEMADQDIFVNVAGGLKVDEPAADLGIVSAMLSSFLEKPVSGGTVLFGEVGLAGEIRGVSRPGTRIREAKKLGFSQCILSRSNMEGALPGGMALTGIGSILELCELLFK